MGKAFNFENLKQELEVGIRGRQIQRTRSLLKSVPLAELPRTEYATFAGFARRAGLPALALRLLKPVIRPQSSNGPIQEPATPVEVASYALALCSAGALSEARWLVKKIEDVNTAETLQACAYVSIWSWDYIKAIHFLKRYLQLPGLSEFQITLAMVNLAQSHEVLGHRQKTLGLINEILGPARRMGWHLLERDALLLQSQIHLGYQEWPSARKTLEACEILSKKHDLDLLQVRKWQVVLTLDDPEPLRPIADIENLKAEARHLCRWEVVRDLEYYQAKKAKDFSLLNKVYFGTPFQTFRQRLMKATKLFWAPPEEYIWNPRGPGPVLDVRTGRASEQVVVDGLCQKLIQILTSDFYRPFNTGSLFAELYPDKHYDVIHSAHSVANVIQRTRKYLNELKLPLEIQCTDEMYQLNATGPISLKISSSTVSKDASELDRLRSVWPHQAFSIQEARNALASETIQLRKTIQRAVREGQLIAIGETRSRLYRFAPRSRRKAS